MNPRRKRTSGCCFADHFNLLRAGHQAFPSICFVSLQKQNGGGLPAPKVTIHIQLQPEIEAQLAAEARARGAALDRYIEKIVISRPVEVFGQHAVAEAINGIRELRKGNNPSGLKIEDLVYEGHRY
jgi:hypothetical protein